MISIKNPKFCVILLCLAVNVLSDVSLCKEPSFEARKKYLEQAKKEYLDENLANFIQTLKYSAVSYGVLVTGNYLLNKDAYATPGQALLVPLKIALLGLAKLSGNAGIAIIFIKNNAIEKSLAKYKIAVNYILDSMFSYVDLKGNFVDHDSLENLPVVKYLYLKAIFYDIKDYFDDKTKKSIEFELSQIKAKAEDLTDHDYSRDNPRFKEFQAKSKLVGSVFNIPFEPIKIDTDTSLAKINAISDNFPKDYRNEMLKTGRQLEQHGEGGFNKYSLLLLGEPGTGKTWFVNKLAEAYNVPFIKIFLSQIKYKEDLLGGKTHNYGEDKEGALLLALTKHERRGGIIFMDEADKIDLKLIEGLMLSFLDPANNCLEFGKLNNCYPINNYVFVLAANKALDSEPLNDRIKTLKFEKFNLKKRERIALNYVNETKLDKLEIGKENRAKFYADVKTLVKADKNPGIRSLLLIIDDYLRHIKSQKPGWIEEDYNITKAIELLNRKAPK